MSAIGVPCCTACCWLQLLVVRSLLLVAMRNACAQSRQAILKGLVDFAPDLVDFVVGTHAQVTPELLYQTRDGNQVVKSQTGSQQGCSLGGLLFCCGLSIPLRERQARLRAAHENKDVYQHDTLSFADDLFSAVIDPLNPRHQCEDGMFARHLARYGCKLDDGKERWLPPPGHVVTAEEHHYIEVVRGAPIGSDEYIKGQVRKVVDPYTDSRNYLLLARQIALMPDKQAALLVLTKCLTSKLTHVARITDPQHFIAEAGSATAVTSAWVMERIAVLPQTADIGLDQAIATGGNDGTIALHQHQRLQLALPLGQGGFGVTSLGNVSPAAYLGVAMQNVYRALSKLTNHTTIPALDAVDFAKTPVVQGILVSIKLLREQGITDDQLKSVLPAEWVAAATAAHDPGVALSAHLLAAAAGYGAINKGQAKLTALVNMRLLNQYVSALDKLPDADAAAAVRCESKQQAKARHLSLATSESMAWASVNISGACVMQSPEISLTCRRVLGVRTIYGDGLCPKHGLQQSPHDTLDNHHAVTCGNSGLANTLHKDMAYSLISAAKQCGVGGPMIREDKTCFTGRRATANSKHTEWSMDVTIPLGAISGAPDVNISSKQILLDANISNPCSITAIRERHTDSVAGASAAKVETDKAKKYADTFVPATSNLI
eukprot:8611-Heterococcus_DN1.PRE.1